MTNQLNSQYHINISMKHLNIRKYLVNTDVL